MDTLQQEDSEKQKTQPIPGSQQVNCLEVCKNPLFSETGHHGAHHTSCDYSPFCS